MRAQNHGIAPSPAVLCNALKIEGTLRSFPRATPCRFNHNATQQPILLSSVTTNTGAVYDGQFRPEPDPMACSCSICWSAPVILTQHGHTAATKNWPTTVFRCFKPFAILDWQGQATGSRDCPSGCSVHEVDPYDGALHAHSGWRLCVDSGKSLGTSPPADRLPSPKTKQT